MQAHDDDHEAVSTMTVVSARNAVESGDDFVMVEVPKKKKRRKVIQNLFLCAHTLSVLQYRNILIVYAFFADKVRCLPRTI